MTQRSRWFGFLVVFLAGCSGNGTMSTLPQTAAATHPTPLPTGAAVSPGQSAAQRVAVIIRVPRKIGTASAERRRPTYVSTGTQSAAISVNGEPPVVANLIAGAPDCTTLASGDLSCSLSTNAPVGTDTFSETLYTGTNATGAVLSHGTTSAQILLGQANTVALTLDGVVASISLALAATTITAGTPAAVGLTVNLDDASGAAIIGSDPFATPVSLTDSDTSGATSLSKTTLNSPADAASLNLNYAGAGTVTSTIGASAGTISATPVNFSVTSAAFNDYVMFGYDRAHDVFNPNSTAITPASVPNLHLAWQASVGDYNTQTQPILATEIPGHAGVLYVGGGSGKVYAYDALTGTKLWSYATGQEQYSCENGYSAVFGIGGSAAYDPGTKSIYIAGNSNTAVDAPATNTLYRLDAATGALLGRVDFGSPNATWPSLDFAHTAVTLGPGGLAYVGTGATCDISSWRGRVVAINVPAMSVANTFYTAWNGTTQPWGGGGIWGWGGVSLDLSGNVYAGVGNVDNGSTTHGAIVTPFAAAPDEYSANGDAFIKLSNSVSNEIDSNHPIPLRSFSGNSVDLDLNGTPAIFTPTGAGCDPLAAIQGKSGSLYLYDTAHVGAGPVAQYQLAPSSYADGFLGQPAYSPVTGLLYAAVPSSNSSLYAPGMIAIDPGCGSPFVAWHTAFGPDAYEPGSTLYPGTPRSVPAVSFGGVVFVGTPCTPTGNTCSPTTTSSVERRAAASRRIPLICCAPAGTGGGAVWALDAATGTVLNGGNPLIITAATLRMPPTIDGDWIFVIDNSGDIYALTIDPSYATAAANRRAAGTRRLSQ